MHTLQHGDDGGDQVTHLSVQPQQRHVMCGLRLQEAVIAETEHVGEVWMEEHLGGVIPLDGVILGVVKQVMLTEDDLNGSCHVRADREARNPP